MSVLLFLAERAGEQVPKQSIVDAVWPREYVSDDSLSQCIADIRKALGDADKRVLETVPRVGYRLNTSTVPTPAWKSAGTWAAAGAAAIIALAVAFYIYLDNTSVPDVPTLAVLPLDDLSSEDHVGYLNDALSEGIITDLARSSFFKVVARNSSFQFRGNSIDVREAGDRLGADFIVEGSQQYDGSRLRVTVQLIETETGTHLFSERFDRELGDLFEVENEVVALIGSKLGDSMLANVPRVRRSGKVTSLLRSLQARNLSRSPTRENWLKAMALGQQSIEEDPSSPWGYIGTALETLNGWFNGWIELPRNQALGKAAELARKAQDIAPDNYMSHYAMARVLTAQKDYAGGLKYYRRAAQLNPSDSLVPIAMARPLLFTGQTQEAISALLQAKSRDPLHSIALTDHLGWAYWQNNECEKGLDVMSTTDMRHLGSLLVLVALHVCSGEIAQAKQVMDAYLKARPGYTIAGEIINSPADWKPEGTLDRWLDAMRKAGMPE